MARFKLGLCITAGFLVASAGLNPALAEPPAVLDRVPSNAAAVVAIRNLEQSRQRLGDFMKMMDVKDEPADNPLAKADQFLSLAGVNKSGSMAMVVFPGADGTIPKDEEPKGIILLPVSDFAAFVKGLGGTEGKVASISIENKPMFAKSIGSGYAAVSEDEALVESFEGKSGNAAAHMKLLGKVGGRILDMSDVIAFTNAAAVKPQLEEAASGMKEQGQMVAMMSGNPDAGAGVNAVTGVVERMLTKFTEQGSSAIAGLSASEKGTAMHFAAQFKDGTETAKQFTTAGKSAALLGKLPAQPFYFALAADFSQPAIKQMFKDAKAAAKTARDQAAKDAGEKPAAEAEGQAPGLMSTFANIDNLDGAAMVWGATPALMGGMFMNATTYLESAKPGDMLETMRTDAKKADGTKEGPVTTKVKYTADADTVGGKKVDTWSVKMDVDQSDPAAMQVAQMQQMMFGPAGLQGMNAAAGKGIVTVFSQNKDLMSNAIQAAESGKGLSDDALVKAAGEGLPANRNFEAYVGVKPILDGVMGFMMMMGAAPEFEVPAQITPISMAGVMEDGGVAFHVYVPTDAMKTIVSLAKTMEAANGGDAPADEAPAGEKPAGDPKF